MPSDTDRELTTWAEIALHLGVTQRTAQLWRRDRGLPVRNAGRRVTATVADLDRWKEQATAPSPIPAAPEPVPFRRHSIVALAAACAGVLLGGLIWAGASRSPALPNPVRFEIHGNLVLAFDSGGRQCWSHMFDRPIDRPAGTSQYAADVLADLNGDGSQELLLIPWQGTSPTLDCFRPDGVKAWSAPIGRNIVQGRGEPVLAQYVAVEMAVLKRPRADGGRIVLLSRHNFSWPALIQVFSPDGRLVAEYWHPGWLYDMTLTDLDGDGVEEIVAGGVSNSYLDQGGGAILLALRSGFESGQGPVRPGDHRIVQGVPMKAAAAAIRFPNLPGTLRMPGQYTRIEHVKATSGQLDVTLHYTGSDIRAGYRLTPDFQVIIVSPSPALTEIMERTQHRPALRRLTVLENRLDNNLALLR